MHELPGSELSPLEHLKVHINTIAPILGVTPPDLNSLTLSDAAANDALVVLRNMASNFANVSGEFLREDQREYYEAALSILANK